MCSKTSRWTPSRSGVHVRPSMEEGKPHNVSTEMVKNLAAVRCGSGHELKDEGAAHSSIFGGARCRVGFFLTDAQAVLSQAEAAWALAKLDLRLAQLKAPLMRWVGRSMAELSSMKELQWKAWAHGTVDEDNMPEVLRMAEEKHKKERACRRAAKRAVRWVEADHEQDVEEDELLGRWRDGYSLEGADIPEVRLLEEHIGIPEVHAVRPFPVDEKMFLGRLKAV